MANEVEIVVTGKNKGKPAVDQAKKDAAGIGKAYKDSSRVATTALGHIRDALSGGLHDAIADVNGETNRISRAWREVQDSSARSLDATKARLKGVFSDRDGRSFGRRLAGGIASGLKAGAGLVASAGLGLVKGMFSKPMLVGVLLAAVGGALTVAGPALGALLAGSLVLGMGGAVVGIGAALLAQDAKVKKAWSSTWKDMKATMTDAAAPLRPVLETARKSAGRIVDDLAPSIEKGLKIAQRPLQRFLRNIEVGFKGITPAIEPLFAAFGSVLDELGPDLPVFFESLSRSVINLAETVSANRDLIAGVFLAILNILPAVINGVSLLTSGMRGAMSGLLTFTDGILAAVQAVLSAVASIPGPWQAAAQSAAESIGQTRAGIQAMREDINNFPRVVKLEGEISDLEGKIRTAKAKLRDPKLTNPERSRIKAEISDLQRKVAAAKSALASIRDKSVTIRSNYVTTHTYASGTATLSELFRRASGGISGGGRPVRRMATGGVGGGTPVLVGEQGPEMVNLPFGSQVTAAGQTRARMQQGGGFGNISMAFRQAGGQQGGSSVGGLGGITESLREVLSFREALEKLSRSLIGQTRAVSAYEAAWDAAGRSLKENGKRLSLTSEKGRENRGALLDLAEAAREVVIAMQEQGRSSSTLLATMKEQRAEFIRMARSMGLSKSSASAMADRMGLTTAGVRSALAGGKAGGGPAGGMTLVGERGAELVRLPFGSQVTPAGQTAAMMAGGGGGPVVIELRSSGSAVDDMLLQILRKAVRVRGGNVQLVLGRT